MSSISRFGEVVVNPSEILARVNGALLFTCHISVQESTIYLHFSGSGHADLDVTRPAANQVKIVVGAKTETIKTVKWDVFCGVREFAYVAPDYDDDDEEDIPFDTQTKRLAEAIEAARKHGMCVLDNGLVLHSEDDGLGWKYKDFVNSETAKRLKLCEDERNG